MTTLWWMTVRQSIITVDAFENQLDFVSVISLFEAFTKQISQQLIIAVANVAVSVSPGLSSFLPFVASFTHLGLLHSIFLLGLMWGFPLNCHGFVHVILCITTLQSWWAAA